ncbi:MAG: phosphoglycerate kinase [Candidatus Melainabacteria bacterium]|nr:phosphoglycerate kinase [Candidatus Melainabacteria bacterium]
MNHAAVPTIAQMPADFWAGKRVFVRADLNVPQNEAGHITDDTRIVETLPTVRYLLQRGASVILASHLGRPKGAVVESMRMAPVAKRLQQHLPEVTLYAATEVCSPTVHLQATQLKPGDVLLLENLRFEPGEEANDPALAKNLAQLCDVYVNDAFGAAHRAHASTAGMAHQVTHRFAGLLMAKEIEMLSAVLNQPKRPVTAIIGGSKVSSKLSVLSHLLPKVDCLVIGGGMLFTFLLAQGQSVGQSLVEADLAPEASRLLNAAQQAGVRVLLAEDVRVADRFAEDAQTQVVSTESIPDGWMGLDIGPKSIAAIQAQLSASATVLWNGPVGVFEMDAFATGTRAVAQSLADLTESRGASFQSILGGGDTVAALERFAIAPQRFTHVSTGGGASLEFLEGRTLPGIAALMPTTVTASLV